MSVSDAEKAYYQSILARRIGEEMRHALAEDRLIRTGQIPETWDADRILEVRRS